MTNPFNKEDLIQKVENAEQLTNEEEAWYLENVLQFTSPAIPAGKIISIADNQDGDLLID